MAIDPEQAKRRIAARERQRQQKAAQSKKRRIFAFIGGGIVLVAGLLALILSLKGCSFGAASDTTETEPDLTVLHLAAVGDLNVTQKVVGTAGDYTNTFLDVAAILAEADLTSVNFEGGLYGPPYGEDASAPPAMAQALKNAGVDLVQLANSYTIHRGTAGLADTISGMQAAGLTTLGAWKNPTEAKNAGGYTMVTAKAFALPLSPLPRVWTVWHCLPEVKAASTFCTPTMPPPIRKWIPKVSTRYSRP